MNKFYKVETSKGTVVRKTDSYFLRAVILDDEDYGVEVAFCRNFDRAEQKFHRLHMECGIFYSGNKYEGKIRMVSPKEITEEEFRTIQATNRNSKKA